MTALWLAVIASGIYHGLNPGMGWPLAVSAALMEQKKSSLPLALLALASGHFLAMAAILLPFSLISSLIFWQSEIRIFAGLLVIGLGFYLLINRRHPRFLSRVPPSKLALWSFLAAMAHGAGMMLVPIFLGMNVNSTSHAGHMNAGSMLVENATNALVVAVVHTASMTIAGGLLAAGMYFWLGLKFLSKTWFNLDVVWAMSLILVGAIGVYSAMI